MLIDVCPTPSEKSGPGNNCPCGDLLTEVMCDYASMIWMDIILADPLLLGTFKIDHLKKMIVKLNGLQIFLGLITFTCIYYLCTYCPQIWSNICSYIIIRVTLFSMLILKITQRP